MAQKLIQECDECGLSYFKPWYEPTWLARRNWAEAYEAFHDNSQRAYGKELERERIIKILEELKGDQEGCCDECKPHLENSRNYLTNLIALIKGENE